MIESYTFINNMLSPAVLISGIGLVLMGANNRFHTLTGRIRELNSEIRRIAKINDLNESEIKRLKSIKYQISQLITRSKAQKYAIFFLFVALMFTVLTVLALAAEIKQVSLFISNLSIIFFITSLCFICVAILLEAYETALALKTVVEDYNNSCDHLIEKDSNEKTSN